MEAILPFGTSDRAHFCNSAVEIGFDEFVALKFVYTMQDSDLDVFQLMGDERLSLLIYGWEVCDGHLRDERNIDFPENVLTVVKRLTHYSLDMWFSNEWERCKPQLKHALVHCLQRAKETFARIPELALLNWDFLLSLGTHPWRIAYLSRFNVCKKNTKEIMTKSIENVEEAASDDDIAYLKDEGIFLILLRLIKMFDHSDMESVKHMAMRVIAAWNHIYELSKDQADIAYPPVKVEHKRCLIVICHIYLMAVYETDDVRGFVIDNMMNNIRFYYQSMQEAAAHENFSMQLLEYTPARFIAMTCVNLRLRCIEFFEAFIYDTFDESFTTLFGAISSAYLSYILGNLLMEMNNMNEQDFNANVENYKRIFNLYVLERERSEVFILRELRKQELQVHSHNVTITVKNMTDFKSKICKGNRMSNIGNYENADDIEDKEKQEIKSENEDDELEHQERDRRTDPIFQNIPHNANILNYVYGVLAKRTYKGWHFAKIVLLLKIIGHDLNVIETWRYHPGLTTEFMLNLEVKLSRHYEDLAKIFQEHPFMEQEFWLTAFYLNPIDNYYEYVKRCALRSNRKRHVDESENSEKNDTKYGLLSSTIDVQEIVRMTNHDTPNDDYEPLYKALASFRLPVSLIKDLLTVTFLPRNKSFAWAVNWFELRKRCKVLQQSVAYKRRLVELNMAEANDKLKFLNIDYAKYKHRPQLDYGSIEEGYEGVMNFAEYAAESDDDDEEAVANEYDNKKNRKKENTRQQRSKEIVEEEDYDEEQDDEKSEEPADLSDDYFIGTRRTRSRYAALTRADRTKTLEKNKEKSNEAANKTKQAGTVNDENSNSSESPPVAIEPAIKIVEPIANVEPTTTATPSLLLAKRNLSELLKERTTYNNSTNGFNLFPDIWNFEAQELQTVEKDSVALLESESLLQKFAKLKSLKRSVERVKEQKTVNTNDNNDMCSSTAKRAKLDLNSSNESTATVEIAKHVRDSEETSSASETAENLAECRRAKGLCENIQAAATNDLNIAKEQQSNDINMDASTIKDEEDSDSDSNTSTTALRDSQECNETVNSATDAEKSKIENKEIKLTESNSTRKMSLNTNTTINKTETEGKAEVDTMGQSTENPDGVDTIIVKEETAYVPSDITVSATAANNLADEVAPTAALAVGDDKNEKCATEGKEKCYPRSVEVNVAKKSTTPLSITNIKKRHTDVTTLLNIIKTEVNLDEITSTSDVTDIDVISQSSENEELLKLCTQKTLKVSLRRLTVTDFIQLRQPRVCIKRMNFVEHMEQAEKRRCITPKVYADSDESTRSSVESTFSQSSVVKRKPVGRAIALRGRKRFVGTSQRQRNTSESSTESDEFKYKRRLGRPPRGRGAFAATSRQRGRMKTLIVTPRSASGLKLRISSQAASDAEEMPSSSAAARRTAPVIDECIQISSSSSDAYAVETTGSCLSPVPEHLEMNAALVDPLYEEEMILFD